MPGMPLLWSGVVSLTPCRTHRWNYRVTGVSHCVCLACNSRVATELSCAQTMKISAMVQNTIKSCQCSAIVRQT